MGILWDVGTEGAAIAMDASNLYLTRVPDVPRTASDANWITNSHFVVVTGNCVNGVMRGRLFAEGDACQFLSLVRVDVDELQQLPSEPGLYLQIGEGACLRDLPSMTLRAGIHDIQAITRVCVNKKLRAINESLWKERANVCRLIDHHSLEFQPGTYCIGPRRLDRARRIDDLTENQLDEAHTYIRQRVAKLLSPPAVKKTDIVGAIERLYGLVNLAAPPVVVAASPLSAHVVANVAAAYWTWTKDGKKASLERVKTSFINNAIKNVINESRTAAREIDISFEGDQLLAENRLRQFICQLLFGGDDFPEPAAIHSIDREVTTGILEAIGGFDGATADLSNHPIPTQNKRLSGYQLAADVGKHITSQLFADKQLQALTCECVMRSAADGQVQGPIQDIAKFWIWDNVLRKGGPPLTGPWEEASDACSGLWLHEKFCVVSDFPRTVRVDTFNQLHCDDAPAVEWSDGWRLYFVHGLSATRQIVEAPETLTPTEIIEESNIELRRLMISRYGEARLLSECGAQVIQEDHCGALFQQTFSNDEPLTMVRVQNSTPEPDGTFKFYYLRVPPETRTAREAVAWTFGLEADEYDPLVQT